MSTLRTLRSSRARPVSSGAIALRTGRGLAAVLGVFMVLPRPRANVMGRAWDSMGVGARSVDDANMLCTVVFADRC